jgi:hypothetical protein
MSRGVLPADRESRILQWIHEVFIDLLIEKQQRRANDGLTPTDEVRAVKRDVLDTWTHRAVDVFFEHYRLGRVAGADIPV